MKARYRPSRVNVGARTLVPLAFTSAGSAVGAAAATSASGRKTSLVVSLVAAADSKTTTPEGSEIAGLASRSVELERVVSPVGPCTVIRPGGPPESYSVPNASRFDPNG